MSVAIQLIIDDEVEVRFKLERIDFLNEKILNHVMKPAHGGLALSESERMEYRDLVSWFEGAFYRDILRALRAVQ